MALSNITFVGVAVLLVVVAMKEVYLYRNGIEDYFAWQDRKTDWLFAFGGLGFLGYALYAGRFRFAVLLIIWLAVLLLSFVLYNSMGETENLALDADSLEDKEWE